MATSASHLHAGRRIACDSAQCAPLIIGKITAQHGVNGWVKVFSYTRPVQQIFQYQQWMLAEREDATEWRSLQVTSTAQQAKKLLAKLTGIDDRDSAHELVGKWVAIQASQLASLPPSEYYWSDLIGLAVINQDEVELGMVEELLETAANDVLVVRQRQVGCHSEQNNSANSVQNTRERLLPWSPLVIIKVDIDGQCIRVNWHAND